MLQEGGGIMTERVTFELGEKKYVCISVTSTCGRPFDVASAKYVLMKGKETEASGQCEITKKNDTETVLSALIQPMAKNATYTLEYNYEIPPEILIHEVRVKVT